MKRSPITFDFALANPLSILIVDDNKINQFFLIELLKKKGYEVDTALNGREAVNMQSDHSYDLIFMDISMPEMDGLEAMGLIRGDDTLLHQPLIIAMTANALEHDRERCIEAGADDYLSKPVRIESIQDALRSAAMKAKDRHAGQEPLAIDQ